MKKVREKKVLDKTSAKDKVARGEKLTFAERNILKISEKREKTTEGKLEYGRNVNEKGKK